MRQGGVFAWVVLLEAVAPVAAGVQLPDTPLAERMALADCVIVGRVLSLEEEPALAYPLVKVPGAPKVAYRVAMVRVDTPILGLATQKEVRVGFIHVPTDERPVAIPSSSTQAKLVAGQEGCFFLHKHPEESFYVAQKAWDVLDKDKVKEFGKVVAQAKRCARLKEDPDAGLRSKDAEDRLLAAALLIYRYRTVAWASGGPPRTEPIDAERSRLILTALAEGPLADKTAAVPRLRLFYRLGLTAKDGWKPPRSLKEVPAAADAWLRENAVTYRIERYVPPEAK
jgi:hypothetical protein